ncbi:hypothetical protein BJ742DRAFT_831910 [Cladochytrium replicatum]|nr:hypothetical protein BJ742DRAFT_831910 [Cladochytrium replicatum]
MHSIRSIRSLRSLRPLAAHAPSHQSLPSAITTAISRSHSTRSPSSSDTTPPQPTRDPQSRHFHHGIDVEDDLSDIDHWFTNQPTLANITDGWNAMIERQIALAQAKGTFKNLPGHGKPLPEPVFAPPGVDDLEFNLNKILGAQGYLPHWIEEQGEIRKEVDKFHDRVKDGSFTEEEREKMADEINHRIRNWNLEAPAAIQKMLYVH